MITLKIIDSSDLDIILWELFRKEKTSIPFTWINWLKSLDYVKDAKLEEPTYNTILYFESEQDKMFFLLKYS